MAQGGAGGWIDDPSEDDEIKTYAVEDCPDPSLPDQSPVVFEKLRQTLQKKGEEGLLTIPEVLSCSSATFAETLKRLDVLVLTKQDDKSPEVTIRNAMFRWIREKVKVNFEGATVNVKWTKTVNVFEIEIQPAKELQTKVTKETFLKALGEGLFLKEDLRVVLNNSRYEMNQPQCFPIL